MQKTEEIKEIELYDKLRSLLSEMMNHDEAHPEILPFSYLTRNLAGIISEYEDMKGWMKK